MAKENEPVLKAHLQPITFMTGVLLCVIAAGLILPRGLNATLIRTSILLSAFSMWIFWVTMYIAQMNPIMGPKIPNVTLAWISRKWGVELTKLH